MKTYDISSNWHYSSKNGLFNGWTNLPSCNYLDLVNDKYCEDPFFGVNEKNLFWVSELDWIYEKSFVATQQMLDSNIVRLHFDSIDTVADISINDTYVTSTRNAHIPYDIDIKHFIKEGENKITVTLFSPVSYIEEKLKEIKLPTNMNGVNGFGHIRKPAYQFGWDWGPTLPCSGFDGKVAIICAGTNIIGAIRTEQIISQNFATLEILAEIEYPDDDVYVSLFAPDGVTVASTTGECVSQNEKASIYKCSIQIENPELWFPNGTIPARKQQPLYSLKITAGKSTKLIEIGIRSLILSTEKDQFGEDFCFIVNGCRIFAKGANWIPADSFPARVSNELLEKYVVAMSDANYNMIRIWGGGLYASDVLMHLCDKYGILVWQDFMFACGLYPFDDSQFLESVKYEVESNVKRLRTHPSLALLCGNNEIEAMSAAWSLYSKLLNSYKDFFYETLPTIIQTITSCRYWPTSPGSGKHKYKINSDDTGDTHIWSVWHGMMPFTYFLKRYTRFCSEFGFESLPPINTIRSVCENDNDLKLHSPIMKAHQKCGAGNDRILYYIIANYRIPKRYDHLTYLSQLTQAESIAVAVDHWRRNLGRCNGALYWQFNDCWPTASWSGIDYLCNYKALHYYAHDFYSPIGLSFVKLNNTLSLYAVNDSATAFSGKLDYRLTEFSGAVRYNKTESIELAPYSVKIVDELNCLPFKDKFNRIAAFAQLNDADDEIVIRKTCLLVRDNQAKLEIPSIDVKITKTNDAIVITLLSNTFVRKLMLDISNLKVPFFSNYIDLEPNIEYKTGLPLSCGLDPAEILEKLQFISYADIEPKYSRQREKLTALRISLIPINFIGRIIYKFM
ncbi:MAG: hypothetical protein LBU04_05610 [Christensenellaceae bacterium]|nr:hypothetical protein [Christensenellaceae bacterium]